ncbi:unnamed protein product [Sphagnum jensenii]|uniref:Uncharacterized protein n=2 Tax=Sphagnum jensenii TaxID=128206 RepID=A0ABP0X9W0_9BRYO
MGDEEKEENPVVIEMEWVDSIEWAAIELALASAQRRVVDLPSSNALVGAGDRRDPQGAQSPKQTTTPESAHDVIASKQPLATAITPSRRGCELRESYGGGAGGWREIVAATSADRQRETYNAAAAARECEGGFGHTKRQRRSLPAAWGQTNLSQLTVPWQTTNAGKVKSKLPLLQFKGRIVYSKSEAEVNMAAEEILEIVRGKRQEATAAEVAMGFDTEWKASFQRGEGAGKVAVVQLCLEASRCDVMHIKHSGIPPSLLSILQDSTILKVGVGIHGDAAKLRQDYQIWTHGLVDLSILANAKLISDPHAVKQWSLSSLAQELTCKQVEKVQSIRTGDWEADPLSQPQLLYAATDAFASWHLYQVLNSFPDPVISSLPEGNSDVSKCKPVS